MNTHSHTLKTDKAPGALRATSALSIVLIFLSLATVWAQPPRLAPAREFRKPIILLQGTPEEGETVMLTHQKRLTWVTESSGNLRLTLERNDRHVNTIAGGLPGRGNTDWVIGSKGPDEPHAEPGSGYRIVLMSTAGKGKRLAVSKPFRIASPSVTVLSPSGGSEAIRGDRPVPINWRTSNLEGPVNIWIQLNSNARRNKIIFLGRSENSNHRRGNRYTASWMDAYSSRTNNWESGRGRIRVESALVPGVGAWGEEFETRNTGS